MDGTKVQKMYVSNSLFPIICAVVEICLLPSLGIFQTF